MKNFIAILFISMSILCSKSMSSEISSKNGDIFLFGEITKGDYDRLKLVIKEASKSQGAITLWLNSYGGNVVEAIKMGELISKLRFQTRVESTDQIMLLTSPIEVYSGAQCSSACFFIFLGGSASRVPSMFNKRESYESNKVVLFSTLGIHRPYFPKDYYDDIDSNKAEKNYQSLFDMTKQYLLSMGMSHEFIDKMFRVNSGDIEFLTWSEFEKYVYYSPVFMQELIHGKCYSHEMGDMSSKESQESMSKCGSDFIFNEQQKAIADYFK